MICPMTSYLVRYQTRRRAVPSIYQGNWQDKEDVVVAGDDAREAVDAIIDSISGHDFRLMGVEKKGMVSVIAKGIVTKTNQISQVPQNTTG